MITYTWCIVICNKGENNSTRIDFTGCKNLSAFEIVAGHETLFCRPLRQLLAIRYNSSAINSKLFSPSLFQYCWIQYWYIVRFVRNTAVIPNIKYILHYNVCVLTFATVERPSCRSANIFVNISQICIESVLSPVKPSLDKCICVLVLEIRGS